SDLNGTVELVFREDGLSCLMTFPFEGHTGAAVKEPTEESPSDDTATSTGAGTQSASVQQLVGVRILLVEDEGLLALELKEVFNSMGAKVIGPFGGLNVAMQAARAQAIDVAILDVNLKGELVYPLAAELAARGVPFLFLTGYDTADLPDQ